MVEQLCVWAGITPTDGLRAKLDQLIAEPVNALSAPMHEKWRRDHPDEIGALLERIAARSGSLGYAVDAHTGAFTIAPT